ncbi:MAG: hypothetical protein PHG00_09450 [Methylococcales bacterium]|nr:hypothetical protein [Methylococcales bacterium]
MAYTQTDLDNLEKAITSGKRSMQYNGRRIEWQSLADMLKARDAIKKEVDDAQSEINGINRPRGYRARTRSGH